MREQISQLIIEVQQTLLQTENSGVKAMCCCLLTRFQQLLDANHTLAVSVNVGWVPVTERLPEHGVIVLVFDRHGDMFEACYNDREREWESFHRGGIEPDDVTHWHEIEYPEPPEKQL